MKFEAVVVTSVVLVHHVIAYLHGGAHNDLAISMAVWQNAFINFVINYLIIFLVLGTLIPL